MLLLFLSSGMRDFEGALFIPIPNNGIAIRPTSNTPVFITLTVDNVAQEGTERGTLRLVLREGFTQSEGSYFRRDLEVTINDTSSE